MTLGGPEGLEVAGKAATECMPTVPLQLALWIIRVPFFEGGDDGAMRKVVKIERRPLLLTYEIYASSGARFRCFSKTFCNRIVQGVVAF
jgi:hypothetical protein